MLLQPSDDKGSRRADGQTIPSKLLAYQLISGEITQGHLAERLQCDSHQPGSAVASSRKRLYPQLLQRCIAQG